MCAMVFMEADGDPTVLSGAELDAMGGAYCIGKSDNFIFEACEYMDSFLDFNPSLAIILNIELDHVDFFGNLENVIESFRKYIAKPGKNGENIAVINLDSENAVERVKLTVDNVEKWGTEWIVFPNAVYGSSMNYAVQYGKAIQTAYPYLSYYSDLWNQGESERFRPLNGKTVYIPIMTTSGARAANRDQITGVFNRNFNIDWQAMTLTMDREWDTLVDPLDVVETNEVATIANVTRVFNEQQKVPEQDAYMSMKLAAFAAANGGTSSVELTSASILSEWDKAIEYMTNQRVNRDRVVAYMTPATYKLLKQATGMTRFIEVTNGIRDVDRNVARLDGVTVVEVPADLMKTAYTFTEGWTIADGAAQINFMLVDPMAVAAPIKYETALMSAPTAQSKGKYLYYERYYYGAFVLNQRQAGVYANLGAAPSVATLTVTSTAGSAAGSTSTAAICTPSITTLPAWRSPLSPTALLR